MPRLDRSGPMGAGPMTGGRRGTCGRAGVAINQPAYGSGYGRGNGFQARIWQGPWLRVRAGLRRRSLSAGLWHQVPGKQNR